MVSFFTDDIFEHIEDKTKLKKVIQEQWETHNELVGSSKDYGLIMQIVCSIPESFIDTIFNKPHEEEEDFSKAICTFIKFVRSTIADKKFHVEVNKDSLDVYVI